jgi:hypothetical protein
MEATLTAGVTRSIDCADLIGQAHGSPHADYLGVHVLVACHSTVGLPVRAAAAWLAIANFLQDADSLKQRCGVLSSVLSSMPPAI